MQSHMNPFLHFPESPTLLWTAHEIYNRNSKERSGITQRGIQVSILSNGRLTFDGRFEDTLSIFAEIWSTWIDTNHLCYSRPIPTENKTISYCESWSEVSSGFRASRSFCRLNRPTLAWAPILYRPSSSDVLGTKSIQRKQCCSNNTHLTIQLLYVIIMAVCFTLTY